MSSVTLTCTGHYLQALKSITFSHLMTIKSIWKTPYFSVWRFKKMGTLCYNIIISNEAVGFVLWLLVALDVVPILVKSHEHRLSHEWETAKRIFKMAKIILTPEIVTIPFWRPCFYYCVHLGWALMVRISSTRLSPRKNEFICQILSKPYQLQVTQKLFETQNS